MSTPPATGFPMGRGTRARWMAGVVLCYCIVLIPRGHGIAPAALLLVVTPDSAIGAAVLGALGLTLLAASLVPGRPALYSRLAVGGLVCLGLSLVAALSLSELVVLTFATMMPFVFVSSVWGSRLPLDGESAPRSPEQGPEND